MRLPESKSFPHRRLGLWKPLAQGKFFESGSGTFGRLYLRRSLNARVGCNCHSHNSAILLVFQCHEIDASPSLHVSILASDIAS